MNKRIKKKKHQWLGSKGAGAYYCANRIACHIERKFLYSGIVLKPSYRRNIRRYVHWFFIHSSEKEWDKIVSEAYYTHTRRFSQPNIYYHQDKEVFGSL